MWVLVVVIALMIPLIAVVLDSQLGRALAGRIEGSRRIGGDEALSRRVAQLETEIDRLNRELLRLDEETTFLNKLLEEKPAPHGDRMLPGPAETQRQPGKEDFAPPPGEHAD